MTDCAGCLTDRAGHTCDRPPPVEGLEDVVRGILAEVGITITHWNWADMILPKLRAALPDRVARGTQETPNG